jgi:hypothetical protein
MVCGSVATLTLPRPRLAWILSARRRTPFAASLTVRCGWGRGRPARRSCRGSGRYCNRGAGCSAVGTRHLGEVTMRSGTVFVLGVAFVLCGCSNSPTAVEQTPFAGKIGQNCTVQFRRGDGLGAGSSLPVPPTTNAVNGAEVFVSGKLQTVGGGWVVVEGNKREYCIPRESILLIEFGK